MGETSPSRPRPAGSTISEDAFGAGYEFVEDAEASEWTQLDRRPPGAEHAGHDLTVNKIGPNQYAKCTVRNRILPGTIEIEKVARPESEQESPFAGTLGLYAFTLVDDGTHAHGGRACSRTWRPGPTR